MADTTVPSGQGADGSPVAGVAGRYAAALFELAVEAGAVDAVEADLDRFEALVNAQPDLQRMVRSPVIPAEEQSAALAAVLDKVGITGLSANFLRVVAAKRRLFAVEGMGRAYRLLANERRGVLSATVTVAEPLSETNRAAVAQALAEATGRTVRVTERVDPAIIGGLTIKLGSRLIDASLATRLNSLRLAMKRAS